MEIEKYKEIVDSAIDLFSKVAKFTETEWDDKAAVAVRSLFDALLGPVRFGEGRVGYFEVSEALEKTEALPAWVLPLILAIVKRFLK